MMHFRMNMPFFLMAFYGSVMIAIVLALRAALKNRLPKFVFPVLWGVVLLRLLVPFSISSPLSLPVPGFLSGLSGFSLGEEEGTGVVVEDATQFQSLVPGTSGPVSSDLNFGEENSTGVENIGQTVAEEVTHGFSERAIPYGVMDSEAFFSSRALSKALPVLYLLGLAVTAGILGLQKYLYRKSCEGVC